MTIRALVALALAAVSVACAPLTRLPYRADQPPTVTLPVALAGVKDERAAFAALFAAELGVSELGAAARWLHGPGPARLSGARALFDTSFRARAASTVVLMVPGLFGDCVAAQSVPFGDGRVRTPERSAYEAYGQYADLGLHSIRMVPLLGRASSLNNGRMLAEVIRAEAADPVVRRIVLVAYSKGTADALHALDLLRQMQDLPKQPTSLVSVAGVVMGSPAADFGRGLYEAVSPWVTPFDCTPAQEGDLASVTREDSVRWLAAHPPPAGLRYYSVVAHAPLDEMAPPLRLIAAQLANVDARNDGQVVAADAILPGSVLLAEARADHWDVALPRVRHPSVLVRAWTSGRDYPREALLRALLKWVVAADP